MRGHGKKLATLIDVKQELCHPYSEIRIPWGVPSKNALWKLFATASGFTDKIGSPVSATLIRTYEYGPHWDRELLALVKLESGLLGRVKKSDSDWTNEKFEETRTFTCRIIRLKKAPEKLFALLSTIESDRWEKSHLEKLKEKHPYMLDQEEIDQERASRGKQNSRIREKLIQRKIDHPLFHSVSKIDAELFVGDKERGTAIFRPSSSSSDAINITWKFYQGVIVHIRIDEREKPNPAALGRRLVIGKQEFEDLDEIISSYIEPIRIYSELMIRFRSFRDGAKQDIEAALKRDKQATPQRIPYYFGISYDEPGHFLLYYVPRANVRAEFVTVTTEGFRFRGKRFANLEQLVQWFKRHYKEPPPSRRPPPEAPTQPNYDGAVQPVNYQQALASLNPPWN
jgi:transcription elongation factor SPT6